jgi:hypothetical protein
MTSLTWEKSKAMLEATSNVAFEKRKKFKSGVVAGLLNVVLLLGVKENRPDIKLLKVESRI